MNQMIWITILLLFLSGCIMSDEQIIVKVQKEMPTLEGSTNPDQFDINGVLNGLAPPMWPATTYGEKTAVSSEDNVITILAKKALGALITFGVRSDEVKVKVTLLETFTKAIGGTVTGITGTTLSFEEDASFNLFSQGTSFYGDIHNIVDVEVDWPTTTVGVACDKVGFGVTFNDVNKHIRFYKNIGVYGGLWGGGVQIDYPVDTDELKGLIYLTKMDVITESAGMPDTKLLVYIYRTDLNEDGTEGQPVVISWQPRVSKDRDLFTNPDTDDYYTTSELAALATANKLRMNVAFKASTPYGTQAGYLELSSMVWTSGIYAEGDGYWESNSETPSLDAIYDGTQWVWQVQYGAWFYFLDVIGTEASSPALPTGWFTGYRPDNIRITIDLSNVQFPDEWYLEVRESGGNIIANQKITSNDFSTSLNWWVGAGDISRLGFRSTWYQQGPILFKSVIFYDD